LATEAVAKGTIQHEEKIEEIKKIPQ